MATTGTATAATAAASREEAFLASTLTKLMTARPASPSITSNTTTSMRGGAGLGSNVNVVVGRSHSFVEREREWEEEDKRAKEAARERGAWRRAIFLRGMCMYILFVISSVILCVLVEGGNHHLTLEHTLNTPTGFSRQDSSSAAPPAMTPPPPLQLPEQEQRPPSPPPVPIPTSLSQDGRSSSGSGSIAARFFGGGGKGGAVAAAQHRHKRGHGSSIGGLFARFPSFSGGGSSCGNGVTGREDGGEGDVVGVGVRMCILIVDEINVLCQVFLFFSLCVCPRLNLNKP